MDIIVTTPKNETDASKQEAEKIKKNGGGFYFRRFTRLPCNLNIGDKVFYTENGYVRGYAVVSNIEKSHSMTCNTTEREYSKGHYVIMDASSWQWIEPIPYKSFQGFRYFNQPYKTIGDWMDDAPQLST